MGLIKLSKVLTPAMEQGYAVGAFNTADFNYTEGLARAAEESGKPLIMMLPSYYFDMQDMESFYDFNLDRIKKSTGNIVYHLDHGQSFDICMKGIHAGCNSIMFDGSKLPFEENIAITKEIVKIAHACNVEVEAEIGHVAAPEGNPEGSVAKEEFFTNPDDAVTFAKETGVDALAVAVGTVHGVYRGRPKLDYERLKEIRRRVDVPLVMHGGSGLPEEDFQNAIKLGITKVNFFTEMMLKTITNMYNAIEEKNGKPRYIDLQQLIVKTVKECAEEQMEIFGTPPMK